MNDLLDMITTNESPSEIADKIKELLYVKSAEKIDDIRPEIASIMFSDSDSE